MPCIIFPPKPDFGAANVQIAADLPNNVLVAIIICIYRHTHIMHTCVYVCVYIYIYTYTCVYVYIYIYIYVTVVIRIDRRSSRRRRAPPRQGCGRARAKHVDGNMTMNMLLLMTINRILTMINY